MTELKPAIYRDRFTAYTVGVGQGFWDTNIILTITIRHFCRHTVILTILISRFAIAGETPFGQTEDHLNLDDICVTIDGPAH